MERIDNNTDLFKAAKEADKRREAIREANNMQENIEYRERMEKARRKSNIKAKVKARNKERRRVFAKGFVIGALSTSLVFAGVHEVKELAGRLEKTIAVKEATTKLKDEFINRAIENGLGVINEEGKLDTYTAINLDGADPTVVYTARLTLTPEDYNSSIRTISTVDGSGKYTDYQQRLRDIGAIDPDTGTASVSVEKQMVRDDLYTIYTNESYSEVLDTCTDLENKTNERGY